VSIGAEGAKAMKGDDLPVPGCVSLIGGPVWQVVPTLAAVQHERRAARGDRLRSGLKVAASESVRTRSGCTSLPRKHECDSSCTRLHV
jgi:hypothetical protein